MNDKHDRTEQPTPKRRREMREKGSIARSPELGSWASLLVVAAALPRLGTLAADRITGFVHQVAQGIAHPDVGTATGLLGKGLATAAFAALPVVAICTAVGTAAAVAQVGLHVSPKALRFQFSRVDPRAGFSRLVSTQGVWSLAKTFLKLVVLALAGYLVLHQLMGAVLGDAALPLPATLSAAGSSLSGLLRDIGVIALVIAAADYVVQRRSLQQRLRMTRQEVKEEHRQSDGSPEVRRALRSKARQLSRMRMMAAVASADVVVTNPTHYAVAIAYDRSVDRAPRVVAKGADLVALAIRRRATSGGVPVVENPPLARTLHSTCGIDDLVPPRLYGAVAQVLAFVYSLSPTARALRDVHRMDRPVRFDAA